MQVKRQLVFSSSSFWERLYLNFALLMTCSFISNPYSSLWPKAEAVEASGSCCWTFLSLLPPTCNMLYMTLMRYRVLSGTYRWQRSHSVRSFTTFSQNVLIMLNKTCTSHPSHDNNCCRMLYCVRGWLSVSQSAQSFMCIGMCDCQRM